MSDLLLGQVALVTGGGRGIGRAIAQELARAGAEVAVLARSKAELDQTVNLVRAEGRRGLALVGDVTAGETAVEAVGEVERRLGSVDVLVNNAGTARAIGPLWEVDATAWWQDVEVSLLGTFLFCRAVIPGMLARGAGRIVNVSSYVAVRPSPYQSGYASGKAGVLSLTEALASSVADSGVRVFAITPGLVRTELVEHLLTSEEGRRWLPNVGRGKWLEPELAARLAVFLASGCGDELHGRFLHALDDVSDLVGRAEEIRRHDLFAPRLRREP